MIMGAMTTWLPWFVLMVFPWKIQSEFLKSRGDVMVLEGHELELDWTAYSDDDRISPCSWRYAYNSSTEEEVFLAWEDEKRYEFGNRPPWQFTRSQNPCTGGIRRTATMDDTGVYRMETKTGYSLNADDTQTSVTVYSGSSLMYSVTINDVIYKYNIGSDINQMIEPLHTDKPVSVNVDFLSNNFPTTKVSVSRDSQVVPCKQPSESCQGVINVAEGSSSDIVIILETGIVGADHVTITQPIDYTVIVDNKDRNAAIAFGILFFLLLAVIVVAIILLVIVNRKKRKMTKLDVEVPEKEVKKATIVERTKRKALNTTNDLIAAFKSKKEPKYAMPIKDLNDYLKNSRDVAASLTKEVADYDSTYGIQEKSFTELMQGTLTSLNATLKKCEDTKDDMAYTHGEMNIKKGAESGLTEAEYRQHVTVKHLIDQVKAYHDHLTWLKADLSSYEKHSKENREKLDHVKKQITKSEAHEENANVSQNDCDAGEIKDDVELEPKETDTLSKPTRESEEDITIRQLKEIEKLHQMIMDNKTLTETFDFMKVDLQRKEESVKTQQSRILTIDDGIQHIHTAFSNIKKGWEHQKTASVPDKESPTGSSPNPTPAHAAAVPPEMPSSSTSPPPPSEGQPQAKQPSKMKKLFSKSKRKSTEGGGDK